MKQWCGIIVSFLIMISANVFSASSSELPGAGERIILIGNPGVGKSAILNSLVGENIFNSGLSAGEGLTKLFQMHSHEGVVFIDTPGLNDIKTRKEAAQQIEKSLKGGGRYRIFYVLNLRALRVIETDVAAMNLILDAIKVKDLKFNVIINDMTKPEVNHLKRVPGDMAPIILGINSLHHKTDKIIMIPKDANFDGESCTFITIDQALRDFILKFSASTIIEPNNIKKIEIDKFEELKKRTGQELQQLREEIRVGSDRIESLVSDLNRARREIEEERESRENEAKQEKDNNLDPSGFFGFMAGGLASVIMLFL